MFYKAFNQDLTCKGFQYEIGQTHKLPPGQHLEMCKTGFHACYKLEDCLYYYGFNSRFCRVELGPNQITEGNKTVSDTITIVEEIFPECIEWKGVKIYYKKDGIYSIRTNG